MPNYVIGYKTFRRKNLYIPCVIAKTFDDLSDEEKVKIYKKTWWCDLLTNAEWRTILKNNPPSYKKVVRSRLKKKMAGWFIALGRVSIFDPALYNDAVKLSMKLFEELCQMPHPLFKKPTKQ